MKDVCIVLVNYKGHDDTIECLETVLKSDYRNFQVVVIDNSPSDNSLEQIVSWARGASRAINTKFPDLVYPVEKKPLSFRTLSEKEFLAAEVFAEKVLLVKAERNLGFAAGNNIAISYFRNAEKFDFLWLLNNDVVIGRESLGQLVSGAGHLSEKTGMIGAKLLKYHQPAFIQGVGGKYYPWFGKVKEVGSGEKDAGQWDSRSPVQDYIIGASMFVRREFVNDVGPMEEDYFIYFEELDWALRGRQKGWNLGYYPANIYHKMGASTGSGKTVSEISDFYSVRNRILIARRFFPWTQLTLYPAFLVFVVRRILWGMPRRIGMLMSLLINPRQHYQKRN